MSGSAYIEPPQQARHQLVYLQQADVLANTSPAAHPELQHRPGHLLDPGILLLPVKGLMHQPPLRPVDIRVLAKDALVAVEHPRGAAHDRAAGDEAASDLGALGRDDPLHGEPGGGVDAEGLLDARVEVRQLLRLGPGDEARLVIVEDTPAARLVQLGPQPRHRARGAEQVVEDGTQADGRGLGAREGHRHRHGLHEPVRHELRARLLRGEELGQQVERRPLLVRGGQDVALLAVEVGQALGHARAGELGDGEGRVDEAPFTELEIDGVLEEEAVK